MTHQLAQEIRPFAQIITVSDIKILEMYLSAMRLNSGKMPSELDQTYIKVMVDPEGCPRIFIFEPIKPIDVETPATINRIRINEIDSKA